MKTILQRLRRAVLFPVLMCGVAVAALADIPTGYYSGISGKKDSDLKTALHNLLYNHTEISSYSDLPQYFRKTDVYPPGNERYGQWWDMYSDIPLRTNSFSGLNREHSLPKSWWGGSTSTPAYIDLNHLYPSEMKANTAKSNYPLGEVQTPTFDNGICQVGYPVAGQGGGAQKVFEPADEYKGDFARTYFYMACCYQNLTWTYTYMLNNNVYPTLTPWAVTMLLKWNEEDPVSQKEIDRNEEVYKVQANRNPFIDYPELAEYIWGTRKGELFFPGTSVEPAGDPELITPVQDMALDFGEVALGKTAVSSLHFRGENISTNVSIAISRDREWTSDDSKLFTTDTKSISASVVNSANGIWVRVTYNPTALGEHKARLIVSDYDGSKSRGVALHGRCMEVPVLHDITATAASDITSESYTANWDVPADDVIDYYIVTRTRYTNGTSTSEDLVAEGNSLEITECEPGTRESYHVRSSRLGYESAPSNEIYVDIAAGISNVTADSNPLGSAYMSGGVRLVCGSDHTNCRIYDALGRLVREIPVVTNNLEVSLPRGAFFIVTDQQSTPLRVIVRD